MANGSGRVLIVDDEAQIRRTLRATLVPQGYEVWDARRGDEALDIIRSEKLDLVLLDINLPDMNGFEVCRAIRAGFDLVIMMVTVRASESDKVAALNAGADDYLTKPFDAGELLARIRAHLKRHAAAGLVSDLFACDDFRIDFAERTVTREGSKVRLTPKQCELLRYLVSNRGKSLSHSTLLRAIWGPDHGDETALLQGVVAQIRKIIEANPNQPRHIVTIPWFGYQFD